MLLGKTVRLSCARLAVVFLLENTGSDKDGDDTIKGHPVGHHPLHRSLPMSVKGRSKTASLKAKTGVRVVMCLT